MGTITILGRTKVTKSESKKTQWVWEGRNLVITKNCSTVRDVRQEACFSSLKMLLTDLYKMPIC